MTNTSPKNNVYDSLLDSITTLFHVGKSIMRDKAALSSYADYLSENECEIAKFGKVSVELQADLDQYDFTKGFQFSAMQGRLEKLHPLRLKLAKMVEEAKKLSVFPDRYDSKKAIEICRGLSQTCMERMSLGESEKVSELVEANTQKLIALQKLFERDQHILSQIHAIISTNQTVLNKHKAYNAELKKYVSEFPHKGQDDLSVVKDRINVLKKIDELSSIVEKTVATIRSYCDRYNKGTVMARHAGLVHTMINSMQYADVGKIEMQLKDTIAQVRAVTDAFERENEELCSMQSTLKLRKPDIWKEDTERLLTTLKGLLNKDTATIDLNLDQIKNNHTNAKLKRTNDINTQKEKYPWLERRRYKNYHEQVTSRYMSSSDYYAVIKTLKRDRKKCIWLCCGIPLLFEYEQ